MGQPLLIERVVLAVPGHELYDVRQGDAPRALLLLPRAPDSLAGWASRLEALRGNAAKVRAAGLEPLEELGALAGVPAALRARVDGANARVLTRGKGEGLPPLLAVFGAVDLAAALERLHDRGIRHGAVDSDHVLVAPDGRLLLVDPGVAEALAGTAASEAQDVQSLGRLLYLWLTGREATLGSDDPVPADFGFPSRIDRRAPAQLDSLVLRALQAGGARGFKSAKELTAALRQVLRASGAAVSAGDLAAWASKRAAPSDAKGTLVQGRRVELGPLVERRPIERVPDTLVDMPVMRPAAAVAHALAAPTGESTQTSPSVSQTMSQTLTAARPVRRRLLSSLVTGALVIGVVVLGYALGDRGARLGKGKASIVPPLPVPALGPAVAAATGAVGAGKAAPPLPEFQLPVYDPNAPSRPQKPRKPAHEHAREGAHLGHGAYLSLECNRVARVVVDGRDTQLLTPVRRVPIAPGAHRVRLIAALGNGSEEFEIHVRRGATAYRYGNLGE